MAEFDKILEMLWDADQETREAGLEQLSKFEIGKRDPRGQFGVKAIRAAARAYPFKKPERDEVSGALFTVAEESPAAEYIPELLENFDNLNELGKWYAQAVLMKLKSRQAAEAFMALVRQHSRAGKLPALNFGRLQSEPCFAEVFFPELLGYADNPENAAAIYELCLGFCKARQLPSEKLAAMVDRILKSYGACAAKVRAAQRDKGIAWMWEESYMESREFAGLLLDLFGYLPAERVEKALREALDFNDPRVKLFAVISLLRLNRPIDKKNIEGIAHHAETRNLLYNELKGMGKGSLFPESYRTQRSFAESDMVNWLIFPTELDRAPDEIELMKVVTIDTGLPGGIYDYYLFRFRTFAPHWAAKKGWIAGVSGPFRRKDEPTTDALGETFSHFAKWDSKTPDEHVGDVREILKRWREYELKGKK